MDTAKLQIAESKYIVWFAFTGIIISFKRSFRPSAKACKIPQNPCTFGPDRRCAVDNNLRSVHVYQATITRTDSKISKLLRILRKKVCNTELLIKDGTVIETRKFSIESIN